MCPWNVLDDSVVDSCYRSEELYSRLNNYGYLQGFSLIQRHVLDNGDYNHKLLEELQCDRHGIQVQKER